MKIKKVLTVLKCITYAAVNITKFARKAFSHLIMSKNQPSSDNGASSKFSDLHEGVTMKALSRLVEKNIFFSATSIPTSCYFHSKFLLYLQFIYLPLRHAMLLPRSRITFIPPPRSRFKTKIPLRLLFPNVILPFGCFTEHCYLNFLKSSAKCFPHNFLFSSQQTFSAIINIYNCDSLP